MPLFKTSLGQRSLAVVSILLFSLFVAARGVNYYKAPGTNFDTFVYVSIMRGNDLPTVQNAVEECLRSLPASAHCNEAGTPAGQAYMRTYDADAYGQFVRFYTVKPLYTGLALVLHRWFHMEEFSTLRWISCVSGMGLAVVLLLWLAESTPVPLACLLAALLCELPSTVALGKALLPDGFSTFILFGALYLAVFRLRHLGLRCAVLAIPVFARPDNLMLMGLFAAALVYQSTRSTTGSTNWRRPLLGRLALLCIGAAVVQVCLGRISHPLPYAVLFNHSFVAFTPPSTYPAQHIVLKTYLHTVATNGFLVVVSFLILPLLLGVLVLAKWETGTAAWNLALTGTAAVLGRLLIFPGIEARYYAWYELLMLLCLIVTLRPGRVRTQQSLVG